MIDRVYQLLLDVGYPERGIDWLRQHRPALIALLAIGAWALFIGAGWLVWTILT